VKFGILSDIIGQQDDIPQIKLPLGYACGQSEWVHYWHGTMRRLPGRYKDFVNADKNPVQIPDGYPIIHWHYHVTTGGTEYELAFTKAHVYRWIGGSYTWDLLWTCASNVTRWSTADFGPYVIATNNVDKVLSWTDTTPSTDFVPLGGANGIEYDTGVYITKAEHVIECEGYLFLMATTENATYRSNRRTWCTWGDLTDWLRGGSGDAGYNDLEANKRIKACGKYSNGGVTRLITFTQNMIDAMWLTESDLVWESETVQESIGCAAPDSVVTDPNGSLYYLATDQTIRQLFYPDPISLDIDSTIRDLNPQLLRYAQGVYVPTLKHLWWAVPSRPDSTGNDLVIMFNLTSRTWHKAPMAVAAFGFWTGQLSYTIDTIPFATIDGIAWPSIDWAGQTAEYPFLIASDYAGYGYDCLLGRQDCGVDYHAKLILQTDLAQSQAVTEYKRLHGLWVYFVPNKEQGDSAAVSIKGDEDENYAMVGELSLYGTAPMIVAWMPCDERFRSCQFKVEATNDFRFIGVVFDYDLDGDA